MMKKLILGFAIVISLAEGCGKSASNQNSAQLSNVTVAAIQLPTLKCKTCVRTVTNALVWVDGIESAEIDLPAKTATVKFINTKLTLEKIRSTISRAGYDADDVKRDSSAYQDLPDCCK